MTAGKGRYTRGGAARNTKSRGSRRTHRRPGRQAGHCGARWSLRQRGNSRGASGSHRCRGLNARPSCPSGPRGRLRGGRPPSRRRSHGKMREYRRAAVSRDRWEDSFVRSGLLPSTQDPTAAKASTDLEAQHLTEVLFKDGLEFHRNSERCGIDLSRRHGCCLSRKQ